MHSKIFRPLSSPGRSHSNLHSITLNILFLLLAGLIYPEMSKNTLLAQTSGGNSWGGVVLTSSEKGVSGATVQLDSSSGKMIAKTGPDGRFEFPSLLQGSYQLSVIVNGKSAAYDKSLVLPAGAAAVELTVSDSGALSLKSVVAQAGTSGGEQLSSKEVSGIPLNKRDFSQLLLLAAGTMTDTNGSTNFTAQFAINGQRGVEAVFAMDGADISDPEMGGATFSNFNVDAVQEIQSSSGWMPAEIGRGASGFTNIITRSGSAGFHGSMFEFIRNSVLDARNYFDPIPNEENPRRIPPFQRNEFGFTNGGPVILPKIYDGRGKTFYFAQYQGFRQVLGTTQVMPVPTAEQRAGLDTTAYPGDVLYVPVNAAIAPSPGSVPTAELSDWCVRCEHLCDFFESGHQRQSVRGSLRPKDGGQSATAGSLQLQQPYGSDDQPRSNCDRSNVRRAVCRPPAKRSRSVHANRESELHVRFRREFYAYNTGIPNTKLYRPGVEIWRRPL